jgi:hypothetical protein
MSLTAVRNVELEGLRSEFEACTKNLAALQKGLPLEGNPVRRLQLEEQIKEEKRRLEAASARMAILKLGDALLRLNYTSQVFQFRTTIHDSGVAAFLVRSPGSGDDDAEDSIRLLVKRLLTYIPNQISTPPIKVRLNCKVRRSDATALWRELAKKVGSSVQAGVQEVAERVADRLRTQNVVLIFTDLDRIDLAVCMRDFWAPLVQAAQQAPPGSYHLILLLVDYAGVASLPEPHASIVLVGLPHVLRFPDDELTAWVKGALGDLPADALPKVNSPDEAVTSLLQQLVSSGPDRGPDLVLSQICEMWKCPEEELDAWLEV